MEVVSFALAKKLKEKGYPQHWSDDDYIVENEYDDNFEVGSRYDRCFIPEHLPTISAPTIHQVLKWLRDTHKLYVSPCIINDYEDDFKVYWSFVIVDIISGDYCYKEYKRIDEKRFDSYEQAALDGIEYVLDNGI